MLKLSAFRIEDEGFVKAGNSNLFSIFRKIQTADGGSASVDRRLCQRVARANGFGIVDGTCVDPSPNDIDFYFTKRLAFFWHHSLPIDGNDFLNQMTFSGLARQNCYRTRFATSEHDLKICHHVATKFFCILMAAKAVGSENRKHIFGEAW